MLKFLDFINESVSASRKEWLSKNTREGKFKAKMPTMSDEEKEDHIRDHFNFDTIEKVVRSSHDPRAPIDMTRPIPESVKAFARGLVYHFESGVRQSQEGLSYNHYPTFEEGRKKIFAASHGMSKYIGDPYKKLMVDNNTRPILKKLIAKTE